MKLNLKTSISLITKYFKKVTRLSNIGNDISLSKKCVILININMFRNYEKFLLKLPYLSYSVESMCRMSYMYASVCVYVFLKHDSSNLNKVS